MIFLKFNEFRFSKCFMEKKQRGYLTIFCAITALQFYQKQWVVSDPVSSNHVQVKQCSSVDLIQRFKIGWHFLLTVYPILQAGTKTKCSAIFIWFHKGQLGIEKQSDAAKSLLAASEEGSKRDDRTWNAMFARSCLDPLRSYKDVKTNKSFSNACLNSTIHN